MVSANFVADAVCTPNPAWAQDVTTGRLPARSFDAKDSDSTVGVHPVYYD